MEGFMRLVHGICSAVVLLMSVTPGQAFLFLLAAGANQKPSPPPKLLELPSLNADKAIRPSGLPAPLLTEKRPEMPRLEQHAQVSNEDLLRRLERLEQENERLKRQQSAPGPTTGGDAPRGGLSGARLPGQVTSGWWVHMHAWNAQGNLGAGPLRTFRYDQQKFNYGVGHAKKHLPASGEIYVYRYEAWLRVTTAGTYQVGATLNCEFNHWCDYTVSLDGIKLAEFSGNNNGVQNRLVFAARQLEPGDYRMEMTLNLSRSSFLKYNPALVTVEPMIRAPTDMNFRQFSSSELLVPDRRDVPLGPPISWATW
jgi:hypothetical protein